MPHGKRWSRGVDRPIDDVVRDTLHDVTPRAAALAILRFTDYLDLIRDAGVAPTEELCAALFEEMRAICARDRRADLLPPRVPVDEV
jgi:hypothetical protein